MYLFYNKLHRVLYSVIFFVNILFATGGLYEQKKERKKEKDVTMIEKKNIKQGPYTYSYTLSNNMTVVVREQRTIPKVSIQMWYNVGSKDEQIGNKGIAHFIEHLIFKGTKGNIKESLNLSESDINMIAHKLSGYINAFTSYDYTGYLFNMPTQHYKEIFPIIADCMVNARFDEQMINSEMKAVIQELKMRKDNYPLSLLEQLLGVIFQDHPYHYPIIGYKSDLWGISSEELMRFYKTHYIPNNATLVVVGDVNHEEVFNLAEKYFAAIPANNTYIKKTHTSHFDIISKTVTLYREIQQPLVQFVFAVPGLRHKTDILLEILTWILGEKRSSRLYKILVDDLQLATNVSAWHWDLFDYSLFGIGVHPKDISQIKEIEQIIIDQISDIVKNGFSDWEFNRAIKNVQMNMYGVFEDIQDQASEIGQSYLALKDPEYFFTALQEPDKIRKNIIDLVKQYIRPAVMHKGYLLPLSADEKKVWSNLQQESDKKDISILSKRIRTSPIESVSYAQKVKAKDPSLFVYPKATASYLSNGVKVLHYATADLKKVEIRLELAARWFYDPETKQGLYNFVSDMLLEGTKKYTQKELAKEIESRGVHIDSYIGGISIQSLPEDVPFCLELLRELVSNATFEDIHIEKVRNQLFSQIKQTWDNPRIFSDKLLYEIMYKGHPYHKDSLGTIESISAISRDDLIHFYKKIYSPHGSKLAIVGNIAELDMIALVEQYLGDWQGKKISKIEFPSLSLVKNQTKTHYINRDQVVLTLAQLSVSRTDPDYEKLLLFDQIFSGGALGSMASRLFALREATGLFYGISGSLVSGATEEKGLFKIKTIVSVDRLKEAITAIKETILSVIDSITPEEVLEAKRALVNAQIDNFQTSAAIASVFLFLDRYNLPTNYFDNRMDRLQTISVDQIKQAAKRHLQIDNLVTLQVGRVQQ